MQAPGSTTSGAPSPRTEAPAAPAPPEAGPAHAAGGHGKEAKWALLVGALGVVYGDIGTSPLYALKECFNPENPHHVDPTHANVLGILSLIFWSLTMVVTVKYLTFIMKADNGGAGGILALLALVPDEIAAAAGGFLVLLVLFGAALLYGDGVITPAISVLSAVEGLGVATKKLDDVVLPITCGILILLFLAQKRGTAGMGRLFGPIMLVWFAIIAAFGVRELVMAPQVLWALDPRNAVWFFMHQKFHGFLVLGSVVLCITGGEALYADMGHFGRTPIRQTWFALVFPALVLNYFGQGALLLRQPEAAQNPFYALVPSWGLYPVVAIATAATVVASQALISGAYSLTQQAMQLGYFPRVTIVHTSKDTEGQIYIPEINWALLVACVWLVLSFKSSSALAAAYGIAVTGTMGITTVVYYVVVRKTWGWPVYKALPLALVFIAFDLAFFVANTAKFLEGGWFPIAMAAAVFTIMTTWKLGRREPAAAFQQHVPEVPASRRLEVTARGHGFYVVRVSFGYMQSPDVPRALAAAKEQGLVVDLARTSYYLGRETLLPTGRSRMWRWRKTLFSVLARNARPATAHFCLPPNRVVELGMQLDF
ncbi:MAG TPA: KUP/HAK/KT family potassium transporter [Minicystis sp.]|nr:KUP/HAK/KT family potassium transporter [Minicystis sp.]